MSGVRTDVETLRAVLQAVVSFQGETEAFARGSGYALGRFDEQVAGRLRVLSEEIDVLSHERRGGGQPKSELEQMLYDEEDADRQRKLAEVEERYQRLNQLVRRYEMDRDALREQLARLMQGETMNGDAHGLREAITLLQNYLEA